MKDFRLVYFFVFVIAGLLGASVSAIMNAIRGRSASPLSGIIGGGSCASLLGGLIFILIASYFNVFNAQDAGVLIKHNYKTVTEDVVVYIHTQHLFCMIGGFCGALAGGFLGRWAENAVTTFLRKRTDK